jgi:hypothetical protein
MTAVSKCLENCRVEERLHIFYIAPESKLKTNRVRVQGGGFLCSVRK